MLKDKKIRRIKHLMIFSQLLIAAFIIYWLTERYSYEKTELRKDLSREFETSEQTMLDTLIRVKMINQLLYGADVGNNKIALINATNSNSIIKVTKTASSKDKAKDTNTKKDSIKFKFDIKFEDTNSTSSDIDEKISPDKIKDIKFAHKVLQSEKLLIEGVKVFMSIMGDSTSNNPKKIVINEGLDTSILKQQFSEKLEAHKLQPIWITCSDSDSLKNSNTKMFFYSNMLEGKVAVKIENYSFYLIRKLTPNILFSLLLLLTTGAAFIISYSNLKKQLLLNKIRDEFVGNITHELKTPVATVKVALEALNEFNIKDNPEQSAEYIKIATLELDRLDFLIQKVLTSSIYESNSNVMNFEIVDLDEVSSEVIKTLQIRFESENATVTKECVGTEFKIWADRIHIQGIITNLIDNSLKYNAGNPTIKLNINSPENTVELSVSDDGIGIPEEYQNRIFDKFFRVPTNNKHNVKGHGLGLNYVAMVMKQHKGSITVKNNPIKGCTFTLTFPKYKD
ncbi:MAG: sensor histidine kinase [Bacteroidales bacterium]